ncbi:SDR family oxidoreductase [Paenibacillus lutrae]|uniref:SDR family oxidoreductase n=1 Tax=Paenibacillus lutrae TaxID=2078573 RepID=A0A7X3FFA1_9BACL|nr:SDR family oxidoreductase [Paenibacillus lutrae]MVO98633.1 SDR family oxidoreductase [Paenibacillus lutrae]
MRTCVLVTGDSGDLGQSISECLLESGYSVVGLSRTENNHIASLRDAYPDRYEHQFADLSDPESIASLFHNRSYKVTGLINNAALAYDDLVTNARLDELDTMFKVNIISPILLTKYSIRNMILHKTAGSIVNISSISTQEGYKGLSMYAASKGALESFTKGVAREWGRYGIRCNCVRPGFMETSMNKNLPEADKQKIYRRNSLQGPVEVGSVAETTLFLLSEKSSSITGAIIDVHAGA